VEDTVNELQVLTEVVMEDQPVVAEGTEGAVVRTEEEVMVSLVEREWIASSQAKAEHRLVMCRPSTYT